jgi:hypothetical protein
VFKEFTIALAVAIVGTLMVADVVVPFIRARNTPASGACINNLRQLDGAKQQWALEKGMSTNDVPSWNDLLPYLGPGDSASKPCCPEGGAYILRRVGELPTCSIGGGSHSIQQ